MSWWVGWWVGSCEITKNLINLHLIKIIQFHLKIFNMWKHPHEWVGGWVGSLVGHAKLPKIE